jgi:hypothetical protein
MAYKEISLAEEGSQTMGHLIQSVLDKFSVVPASKEYSKIEPNCLLLGFWTYHFLTLANTLSGNPDTIVELLSSPAERATPYIKKLDLGLDTVMHGYISIFKELEQKYSLEAAVAYRIDFYLAGASSPSPRFRSSQDYDTIVDDIREKELLYLSELADLKLAIESGNNESINDAGVKTLFVLADVFQTT